MKTKKKIILISIVAVVVLLVCVPLLIKKPAGKAMRLETAQAERSTIANSILATGTVEPVVKVEVGTQVSGIIEKIHVDYNSVVKQGQLLAEMDKVNLLAELASKEADLKSSKNEYDYQEKNYSRSKMLHEKQLISDTEYETATYTYQSAKSSYERTKSDMTKVRRNLEYATITSPIDGVVISRAVEEGQTVAAGFSTPTLFTIANDLTQMRVIADVDEADIGPVTEGQRVSFKVDAYPEDSFEGEVTQVRLEATTTSSVVTYEVVISAYNPDLKLKPGMTANVTIYTMNRENVLTIPTQALRFLPDVSMLEPLGLTVDDAFVEAPAGQKIVWQQQGSKLVPRSISIGEAGDGRTEVTEGLNENDQIIVRFVSNGSAAETTSVERSPFMPGPPGNNRNSSKK